MVDSNRYVVMVAGLRLLDRGETGVERGGHNYHIEIRIGQERYFLTERYNMKQVTDHNQQQPATDLAKSKNIVEPCQFPMGYIKEWR